MTTTTESATCSLWKVVTFHCSLSQHRGEAFAHHSASTLISSSPSFSHPNPNPHPRALGCAATSTAGNASRCKRARGVSHLQGGDLTGAHAAHLLRPTAAAHTSAPMLTSTPRGACIRAPASCVLYVPEAQGSLPRRATTEGTVRTLRRTRTSLARRACCTCPHTTLPVAPRRSEVDARAL